MEVVAVVDVFSFGWVQVILQMSEIILGVGSLSLGGESVLHRMIEAFFVLAVDSLGCCFGEALSVEVLTCNLRDITSISWDMLSFDVLGGASNPILSL